MNIASRFLTGLDPETEEEQVDDKAQRNTLAYARQNHLIGMGRIKTPTSGQMRRAAIRERMTKARKDRKRQVRLVLQNRQARANLQGQLNVIGNGSPEASAYIARHVTQRYGSVTAAVAHAAKIGLDVPQGTVDYAATEVSA